MTTIHITQDNIDHGLRGSCTQCPVALALREAGHPEARVSTWAIRKTKIGGHYSMPLAVQDFIAMFDQGERVSPMSFEVEL